MSNIILEIIKKKKKKNNIFYVNSEFSSLFFQLLKWNTSTAYEKHWYNNN